ncbi:MAG: type IV pilus assembly protein PilM [Fibrella sp.]|nr:type IV pilus assembly protein PilM [Armatimonadota bacterium]
MANRPSGGTFVGLDIGTATIKAVEVKGAGANLQVTALGIADTPPGTIQQGLVSDAKILGAAIKSLLTKSGIRPGRCVSAASGNAGVVVRVIEVPKMTPKDLAETMKWEIERHIPFAANDVEMGYQKIDDPQSDSDPNNPNMEVLLAVAQRDMVAEHLKTLESAGLQPFSIDVEPLAIGRALLDLDNSGLGSRNVAVVNIGAANTDVGIYKAGTLRFPRAVPIAGDNFTRAIADHLGINMDQAEDEKRKSAAILMDVLESAQAAPPDDPFGDGNFGGSPFDTTGVPPANPFDAAPVPPANPFDSPAAPPTNPFEAPPVNPFGDPVPANPFDVAPVNPFDTAAGDPAAASPFGAPAQPLAPEDPHRRRQREIFDALVPVLAELAVEVGRSVDFFRSRYPTEAIDQVVLCGGSAQIVDLDKFFQRELNIPTRIANPFQSVRVSSRQMDPATLDKIAPAFAVALGLATRDAIIGSDK